MFLWRALKPRDIVRAILAVKAGTKKHHESRPMSLRINKVSNVTVVPQPVITVDLAKSDS